MNYSDGAEARNDRSVNDVARKWEEERAAELAAAAPPEPETEDDQSKSFWDSHGATKRRTDSEQSGGLDGSDGSGRLHTGGGSESSEGTKELDAVQGTIQPKLSLSDDLIDLIRGDRDSALRDDPLGQLIAKHCHAQYRYIARVGWMEWNGKRWLLGEKTESRYRKTITRMVRKLIKTLIDHDLDDKSIRRMITYRDSNKIDALVKESRKYLTIEASETDTHHHLLGCANGVVDLRTGEILPPNPDLLITKSASVAYKLGATHPDWDKALEALPPESVPFARERFGQALFAEPTPTDEIIIHQGAGENGKSSVLGTISAAIGDYAGLIPDECLMGDARSHPTYLMTLRGLRLAVIEELPEGRYLNMNRVKKITGTQTIMARGMHSDYIEFVATHSLMISSNYRPKITETDHGSWRRLLLMEYPYTFVKAHVARVRPNQKPGDPGLKDRLLGESQREAALAWAIQAAIDYHQGGRKLTPPPANVTAATRSWRRDEDFLGEFIAAYLEIDPDAQVRTDDFIKELREFQGGPEVTSKWLKTRLRARPELAEADLDYEIHDAAHKYDRPPGVDHDGHPSKRKRGIRGLKWKR